MPPLAPLELTPGLWDTAAVVAWLELIGADLGNAIVQGAIGVAIPAKPDTLMIVTDTGGGPLTTEGLFDTPTLQIRWRGPQGDPGAAQRFALLSDKQIMRSPRPITVNGVRLIDLWRTGGRPSALTPSPTAGLRGEWTCTYGVEISM